MTEPLFPLIVENRGRTRERYRIEGRLGEVEFMPGPCTLTLTAPKDQPATTAVYGSDTAVARRAAVILEEAGEDALRQFMTTWYYELPDELPAPA